eukprot:365399-Chlamydomonas_euryale.AAC.18
MTRGEVWQHAGAAAVGSVADCVLPVAQRWCRGVSVTSQRIPTRCLPAPVAHLCTSVLVAIQVRFPTRLPRACAGVVAAAAAAEPARAPLKWERHQQPRAARRTWRLACCADGCRTWI